MAVESFAGSRLAPGSWRRLTRFVLLAVLPALITLALGGYFVARGIAGADFTGGVLDGTTRLLEGHEPYEPAYVAKILHASQAGKDAAPIETPGYPPHVLVVVAPFALIGATLAGILAMVLGGISIVVALRAVGVSDWRCYGALALSPISLQGALLANPTIFLVPAVALAWRWRSSGRRLAIVLGIALSIKPLLLPLCVWLFVTGRRRAAFGALVIAAGLLTTGFLVTGIDPRTYAGISADLVAAQRHTALSIVAVASRAGFDLAFANGLAVVFGLIAIGFGVVRWRMRRDERELFATCVVAGLVASPLVHMHYLALLLVPLGMLRPRFGVTWLFGVPFWLMVDGGGPAPIAAFIVYALMAGAVLAPAQRVWVGSDPTPRPTPGTAQG